MTNFILLTELPQKLVELTAVGHTPTWLYLIYSFFSLLVDLTGARKATINDCQSDWRQLGKNRNTPNTMCRQHCLHSGTTPEGQEYITRWLIQTKSMLYHKKITANHTGVAVDNLRSNYTYDWHYCSQVYKAVSYYTKHTSKVSNTHHGWAGTKMVGLGFVTFKPSR